MTTTIKIVCATCCREVATPRCDTDPQDAVELRGIVCPDCDTGGYDMPEYFNAHGVQVSGDPKTFNIHMKEADRADDS